MTNLTERVKVIQSRKDFIEFAEALLHDFKNDPGSWENPDLERYLDALGAVVNGLEGLYMNRGEELPEQPTWKILGEILLTAAIYE